MAIFNVSARDGSVSLVIRARCMSCARQLAADRSPVHEKRLWRDPEMSSVELVDHPERLGYFSEGMNGILKRITT
ncbi:hypothetical protein NBV64_09085 [Alcaligenes sp. DN25]|jgi:hypothetical protein|uniref:hypothetical protein n=1 Tax=Alcaligenes TaxID=507 RepID=UPI001A946C4A|nr:MULTISPECIES: hypothetical protein [Alcaligenes]QXR37283.1 hypothetical protein EGK70_007285 [Alcaligenes aquatilis]URW84481.1 hypothetical protein NBV64_09085 [Alcaligenes sp. DN25]WEA69322.1 hypothetical protein PWH35_09110 [Alcaligenes faecalis]